MNESEWVTIWRFAIFCVLVAFAADFLGGCAARTQEVRIPVRVPVLVMPDCEAPNVLERCKMECSQGSPSQQAIGALESATAYRCFCKPFDS